MTYKIIVSKGGFAAIEDAAYGEKSISWVDFSSDDCFACTECFCALDAKNTLVKMKNLDVEVCDIASLPEDGDVLIFLGSECARFASEKYNLSYSSIEEEDGYRICGSKKDDVNIVLIYGQSRRAGVYAMMDYLERHGIRFVSPGEDGTHYRAELDKSSEAEFDITSAPSFDTRESYSEFMKDTSEDFFMWAFHNKISQVFLLKVERTQLLHKLCLGIVGGGHTIWYEYMDINHEYPYKHKIFGGEGKSEDPYEVSPLYKGDVNGDGILTYGEAHPEWYAEVDGVRTLFRNYDMYTSMGYPTGDFICTSSEDATDEFVKLIVQTLIDGENRDVSAFKLSGLDNGTWCQCEKCRQEETYSYRLLMLAYKLDKGIKKATAEGKIKRKITIEIPAYHETLPPPHRALPDDFDYSTIFVTFYVIERCYVHDINDQKCTETNKMLYDRMMSWVNGHFKGRLVLGEYYNVSTFAAMPFVFTKRMKNDIPFYYEIGSRHFLYMHMLARCWGIQAINNYLYARLMWNVNADVETLMEEYFLARYGEDAPKMKAIYEELEDAGANCKFIKHYQYMGTKPYALSSVIRQGKKEMFDIKHVKLDTRLDDYQAGPSVREMLERYTACFEDFKAYIKDKSSTAFTEDYNQLEYAVNMLNFLYYKASAVVNGEDDEALGKISFYQKKLEETTAPFKGYDYGNKFVNGFTATGVHEV